ncbi:hypothetical protein K2F40_10640 [Clostridium sp. CM028]|uniref:hypothetical protein n=1 Tax=Clostridium TaxID=1485 RepID=UPI0013EEE3AF|nr:MULTISPECIES: hypothetical protein [Clostridium]MBU3090660.1 hypothetical protein [Clostridium sp. CF011]MBW9144346.1 hypothetical protein [Clostridium sp. CM027]MBW9149416.1 hypothetical protein [Clostridium sp. CM028]MBZ9608556.1 hypothetical protein [Clostridium estertheticum]UVE41022.1 hypothetical protein KTC92_00510 [Clostridium sp. CM027]
MKLEDRNIEDIDMKEEYEMVPLEPMMYGYGQMNMMPNMGMNPNVGMNPNMGMQMGDMQDVNPNMGINSIMGMNQFNEDMFMNGSNPMGMTYGDVSMKGFEQGDEDLRQLDNYQDRSPFDRPNPQYNDVESIVRRIERYNPAIFRRLNRCGIPYLEAKEIVRRIVRVTLMYRDE